MRFKKFIDETFLHKYTYAEIDKAAKDQEAARERKKAERKKKSKKKKKK